MPLRNALSVLAASTLLSLLLAAGLLAVRGGAAEEAVGEQASGDLIIEWAYRPADVDELTAESEAVIVATVSAVSPGEPIELSLETSVPTRLVDLQVDDVLAGEVPAQLTLSKVGAADLVDVADPAYHAGERYLLFVREQLLSDGAPSGLWLATAPDGRLEEQGNGTLQSRIEGPVADELDGESLAEAEAAIDDEPAGATP